MELNEHIFKRLEDDNFNKDLRSDLYGTLMYGYLAKEQDMDTAHEMGITAVKLNEDNWKVWKVWLMFYKRLCQNAEDRETFLENLASMILCYVKAIKYRTHVTLLCFADILELFIANIEFFE